MKTLVVIPTYNEKENIEHLVRRVFELKSSDMDVLVVDDSSPDGTADVVEGLRETYGDRLFLLKREAKKGLGSAYMDGFAFGVEKGYLALCEMDADGSHDPKELLRMQEMTRVDRLIVGSRRVEGGGVEGWNRTRRMMSYAAGWLARKTLRLSTKDVTSGYRCYGSDVVKLLLKRGVMSTGYAFQEEALYIVERAGLEVIEIPIVFTDRKKGASKLRLRDMAEFFKIVFTLRKREGIS